MSKAGPTRRKKQVSKSTTTIQYRRLHDFKIEEHNAVIQMAGPKVARATVPAAEVSQVIL